MTNDTIKKLLSKRKWTGEEVGKILVISLINDIKNQQKTTKQKNSEKLEKNSIPS